MTDGPSIPPPPAPAGSSNLISRVLGMITNPAGEWRKIDGESTSLGKLVTTYTLILSAILPIAFILGAFIAGAGRGGGIGQLILIAAIYYALQVGVTIALAFIIDALAPSLGGTKNSTQAAKLAVYSSTPLHLVGIIGIIAIQFLIGGLAWLWIIAGVGWGAFLLFLGLPILMRAPADKAPAYAGASIGAWLLLWIIAKIVMDQIVWNMIFGAYYGAARAYGL
jgi:hypothetical protein